MDPISWIKTRGQIAGLMAAVLFFVMSSGFLGVVALTTKWDLGRERTAHEKTKAELTTANRHLGSCQAGQAQLAAEIDYQNGKVRELAEQASAAEQAGLRKLRDAQAQARFYAGEAVKLAAAKPVDPANLCRSAEVLIDETLGQERAR